MENLVSKLAFYDRNALVDSELEPDFSRLLREYVPYPVARADYQPSATLNGKQVSSAKKLLISALINSWSATVWNYSIQRLYGLCYRLLWQNLGFSHNHNTGNLNIARSGFSD
jgi:hypothetical protein